LRIVPYVSKAKFFNLENKLKTKDVNLGINIALAICKPIGQAQQV